MDINIVFGWHLDGLAYPETSTSEATEIGGLVVGPAGLSQQLSLRLGVFRPVVPQAVRIAHYMQALRELDDGSRFYSKSFALDAWSTASCLLVMRDQLIAGGWTGEAIASECPKLNSLSLVEKKVYPLGSPAEATRQIISALHSDSSPRLPFGSLTAVTPIRLLPSSWQTIIGLLREKGVKVQEVNPYVCTENDSDLRRVQEYLTTGVKSQLEGDGSFCLLEADDEYQLAEVTAAWLSAEGGRHDELVILRNCPTTILDAHCSRLALPRLGSHDKSRWRSALQVLPLTLQCRWLPANPYRTLELISLPEGPLPRNLTYHFVQALRVEPGFGGERWASAWRAVEADLREAELKEEAPEQSVDKFIKSALQNLRFWLEPERYDAEAGMPVDQVIGVCRQVSRWASNNIRKDGASEMFLQALNAAQELEKTLIASGLRAVTKIQMDRILDAVSGEGCRPERWHAQAAEWSLVDHPGQIWGSAASLCWWGFKSKSFVQSQFDPWSEAELRALDDARVKIEQPAAIVIREAHAWRQAVLNTRHEVLFCRARLANGQPVSRHPLWDEVEDLVAVSSGTVVHQAHQVLARSRSRVGKRSLLPKYLEVGNPPGAHRHWSVPSNRLIARLEESASSLRELLGCPMAWVLRYQAQMHPGILLTLPDGDELIGDIAHELFRCLFQPGVSTNQVSKSASELFDDLAATVGLPLLLPGRSSERDIAKRLLVSAADHFSRMITDARLTIIDCEAHRERTFGGGKFLGDIDALLRDQDGNLIVIDYKWTRSIKYRLEEIERAQHLQLAAYAWLETAMGQDVKHVGYYMLRQRRLIHTGTLSLSVGQEIEAVPINQVWTNVESEYSLAMDTLRSGDICAAGVPENGLVVSNSGRLLTLDPPCKFCRYGNICGRGIVND